MTRFWISWTSNDDAPEANGDLMPLGLYRTGYGDGYSTMCGLLDADTAEAAHVAAKACDPGYIEERFTEERPDGWVPYGSRFLPPPGLAEDGLPAEPEFDVDGDGQG